MRRVRFSVVASLLATVLLACVGGEDTSSSQNEAEEPEVAGRLLVADGAAGRLVVVDLATGEAVASLAIEGPARVYASSDGLRGFAVQTNNDAVQGVLSGIRYENHGDHVDAVTSEPELLAELVVSCSRPVHFVPHAGFAAAFCDGDGMLHVFQDTGYGEAFSATVVDSGRPHHGVGVVAFDRILVSSPNPDDAEDALPVGVRALDLSGNEEAEFHECPGLHGEVVTDEHACFGCSDGVLCLYEEAGELQHIKLSHPEGAAEGLRVGRLATSGGSSVMVGNWGEDLVLLDVESLSLSAVAIGETYLSYALTEDGAHVVVLTAAGELRRVDLSTGETVASVMVLPNFEVEAGHGQLRPTFILSHAHAYVVDPRYPEIYEVDMEEFALTERRVTLDDGQYHSLALVAEPAYH